MFHESGELWDQFSHLPLSLLFTGNPHWWRMHNVWIRGSRYTQCLETQRCATSLRKEQLKQSRVYKKRESRQQVADQEILVCFRGSRKKQKGDSASCHKMSQQVPVSPQSRPTQGKKSRDIFKYMLTPDRIPEFIIPSLDILPQHRLFGKEKAVSGKPAPRPQAEVKDQRNFSYLSPKKDCSQLSSLPCCSSIEMGTQVEDSPDQVTRAALSLLHLRKITTPYGFVSLGESPHVTKEEALFFQVEFASLGSPSTKRYSYPHGNERYCDTGTPELHTEISSKDHCLQHASKAGKPSLARRRSSPVRSYHRLDFSELTITKNMDGASNPSASLVAVCPRSNSSSEFQGQTPQRNLFKKILKKHFAQCWRLKVDKYLAH